MVHDREYQANIEKVKRFEMQRKLAKNWQQTQRIMYIFRALQDISYNDPNGLENIATSVLCSILTLAWTLLNKFNPISNISYCKTKAW